MTAHTLGLASLAYLGDLRALRERQGQLLDETVERGNALASVCLTCGPANVAWLAADEPREARRRADQALAAWRHDDLQIPRYLHLVAATQTALYEDDARGALERLTSAWPRLLTSMSLYVQNFRVTLLHLRARAALALLAREPRWSFDRVRLVRRARIDARRIGREDVAWAPALAATIDAGLAAVTGDDPRAASLLARAAAAFGSLDMKLHSAAADFERGRLVGGGAGRALKEGAEAWMLEEGVKNPERLAATLIPGIPRR
jgi:hypothetical protein